MKHLKIILLAALTAACSGDDEDGSPSAKMGVLDTMSGLRLTRAGGNTYVYGDDGRLLKAGDLLLSYNPNTIISGDGNTKYTVSYNSSGYISAATESSTTQSQYAFSNSDVSYSFSYDGSGRLTTIEDNHKYSVEGRSPRDITYDEVGTTKYTLTWNNSLLQRITVVTEDNVTEYLYDTHEIDPRHSGPQKYVTEYHFFYDDKAMTNYVNKYFQYADFWEDVCYVLTPLAYVGLFGKGPACLPSKIEVRSGESSSTYSSKYTYRYTFNSEGAIATDKSSIYSYDHIAVETNDNTGGFPPGVFNH